VNVLDNAKTLEQIDESDTLERMQEDENSGLPRLQITKSV